MSRGDENLDKMFQDAFSGQEHQMDPVFWEGMKPMLQTPKVAWYLSKTFMAISTITVLSTSVFLISDSTPETQTQTNINTNEIPQKNNVNSLNSINYTNKEAGTESINTTNSNTVFTDNDKEKEYLNTTEVKKLNTETTAHNSGSLFVKNDSVQHKIYANAKVSQYKKLNSLNNLSNSTKSALWNNLESKNSTEQKPTDKISTAVSPTPIKTEFETTENKIVTNKKTTKKLSSSENKFNGPNLRNDLFNSQREPNSEVINSVNNNTIKVGYLAARTNLFLPVENEELAPSSLNSEKLPSLNKPFSIRLSSGYLWSNTLSQPSNTINYTANSANIELSLEYHFQPRWGVLLGISFNQISENQIRNITQVNDNSYFDYTDREISLNDSTWWLGGWFYYPPRQETITDTTFVSKFDTNNVDITANQKIKVVEIPVLLTYNFSIEQFTLQVATGTSIGIFTGVKGNYLEFGDPIVSKGASKSFFNSLQFNYLLRTEIGYALNDHWQVSASPQMKLNLNSMYKTDSGFNNKYLFYGINAGLIYHF